MRARTNPATEARTRAELEQQAAADLDAAIARAALVLTGSHLYAVAARAVALHGQS